MQPDHRRRIYEAIVEKLGPRKLVCPISGEDSTWEINRYLSAHPALEHPTQFQLQATASFPVAVLMCQDCGYSLFINLIQLGLADELGIPVIPDE